MGDTVIVETPVDEIVSIVTQGPQGPSGSEAATLTTTGDLLYRAALANDRLPIGSEGQVLKVSSGLPAWGNESGSVTSVAGRTGDVTLAVADVANAVSDSDARLTDARTPTSHAASHATGGSDAIAPTDIGAQEAEAFTEFATDAISSPLLLAQARNRFVRVGINSNFTLRLPDSNIQLFDQVVVFVSSVNPGAVLTVEKFNSFTSLWETVATINTALQKRSFRTLATQPYGWGEDSYFTTDGTIGAPASHTHAASDITSGTLDVARLPVGIGSTEVAAGDHTHELNALDATGATDGHVLTADGAGGAAFEALPASGIAETLLDAKGDLIVASAADTAARLAVGANGTMLVADSGETTGVKWAAQPVEYVIACSDETTDLTTGTAKITFRAPVAFLLTGVVASVNTAPTGSTLIVDINNGANSALSTKLSIDASEKTSATAATAAVIDTTYDDFAADAEITIDIDQIGSTVAGKGLKVILKGTRAS